MSRHEDDKAAFRRLVLGSALVLGADMLRHHYGQKLAEVTAPSSAAAPKVLTLEACVDCGRLRSVDELVNGSCCGRAA